VHVIIDGYNLIMTSAGHGSLSGKGMMAARQELISELVRYRRIRGHAVTVVFDAAEAGGVERGIERNEGINVIFTRGDEKADDLIVELVEKTAGIERVVVTSDKMVARSSNRRGAAVISSEGFAEKVEAALKSAVGDEGVGGRRSASRRARGRGEASIDKL
jgi:predicted RNA-binding protein with PIN domain